jgi:carbamoylphosphate synthase small subunit
MMTFTNPLIGNYGTRQLDRQSSRPQVSGLILRELSRTASNFASEEDTSTPTSSATAFSASPASTPAPSSSTSARPAP